MKRIKIVGLALMALVAVSAVSSASASAAECKSGSGKTQAVFCVKGEPIAAGKTFAATSKSGESTLFTTILEEKVEVKLKLVCKTDKGTDTLEPEGKTTGTTTFEECKFTEPTAFAEKCTVTSVVAKYIDKLEYEVGTTNIVEVFEPVPPSTTFATIVLGGAECPLKELAVKGSVIAKLKPQSEEKVTGEVIFKATGAGTQELKEYETATGTKVADTLTAGGRAAALNSTETVELTSKEVFGVFDK